MSDADKIRVLIVDDQELVRSGYKVILSTYSDIEVVGIAKNGREAIELAQTLHPDVVLMDIRMPDLDGISATRDIIANPSLPDMHVLVLTTFDMDEYVYDALQAGASGFLLKDADPDDIANAIRIVDRGEALIAPSVMARIVKDLVSARPSSRFGTSAALAEVVSSLTEREVEILRLVAKGKTNDEIASELVISPATVKTHVARIMAKTSSHDRAQLVVFAYESGLV